MSAGTASRGRWRTGRTAIQTVRMTSFVVFPNNKLGRCAFFLCWRGGIGVCRLTIYFYLKSEITSQYTSDMPYSSLH